MMLHIEKPVLIAALCLLSHPLLAADGILIVEKSTTGAATRTSQVQIEKTRMRSESAGPNGSQIMVFDGAAEVMRTIDIAKKTYTEMTKADVERLGAQMSGAMAKMQQMQEQMKNMPPAARAQMEAMMKAAAGCRWAARPRPSTGRPARPRSASGRATSTRATRTTSEDLGTLHRRPEGARLHACRFPGHAAARQLFQDDDAAGRGSDVQRRRATIRRASAACRSGGCTPSAGQQTVSELTDVSRQTFPDSIFAVPAGFTKQTFGAPR